MKLSRLVVVVIAGCSQGQQQGNPDASVGMGPDAFASADAFPRPDAAPPGSPDAAPPTPDAAPTGDPLSLPIDPAVSCAPTATACDTTAAAVAGLSYRKDFFYPLSDYPEAMIPDPSDGGRVHAVLTATASGTATAIRVDGQDSVALLDSGWLDWVHVWPDELVAGQPVWVSFHSQSADLDSAADLTVAVDTAAGVGAEATLAVARPEVPITYVTPTADRSRYLIHVANRDSSPHTLSRLIVDGRDVTASACIPETTLAAGQVALWEVELCSATETSALWSVVAEWTDAAPSVAAGRVIPSHFPIHTWPRGSDCPLPGGNRANFDQHRAAGFDTFFLRASYGDPGCNGVTWDQVQAAAASEGIYLFPDEFTSIPAGYGEAERIPARLLADEADKSRTDGTVRTLAETSQAAWRSNPTMATYIGGSRHRNVGTFAGAADIQGMDFYVAGCAPHITDFLAHPPLRGAYDYLRATRENQMPLPTWLYTQGLSDVWNSEILGLPRVAQPDATEATIQAWSAIAAGAKGLMYFQTDLAMANGPAAATWQAIATINREVGAIRELLLLGDPTGAATASSDDVIVEALRSPRALVVVIINLANSGGVDDITCNTALTTPHWQVDANAPDVTVAVPPDAAVVDIFELRDGAVVDPPAGLRSQGRSVVLPDLALDAARPTRTFVFAADADLRSEIAAGL